MRLTDEGLLLPAVAVSLAIHGLVFFISVNGPSAVQAPGKREGYSVEVVSVVPRLAQAPGNRARAPAAASAAPREPTASDEPSFSNPDTTSVIPSSPMPTREGDGRDGFKHVPTAPGTTAEETNMAAGADAQEKAWMLRVLEKKIQENRWYPIAARKRGIQGSLMAQISVDERGALLQASLLRSSGSDLLDRAGMDLLRKIFPLNNDTGLRLTLEIPIAYKLEGNPAGP
jgi:TonB family protein